MENEKVTELRALIASALLIVDELNDEARRRKNKHIEKGVREPESEAKERVELGQMFRELRSASRRAKSLGSELFNGATD